MGAFARAICLHPKHEDVVVEVPVVIFIAVVPEIELGYWITRCFPMSDTGLV